MRIGSTRLSCHAVDCVMQKLQKIQVHICKRSVHVPICNPCKTEPTSIFLRMPRGCADGGEGLDQLRVSFRARINCLHLYAVKCYSKKRESKRGTSNSLTLQRRGERGGRVWSDCDGTRSSKGQVIWQKTRTLPQKIHSLIIRQVAIYRDGGNRVT